MHEPMSRFEQRLESALLVYVERPGLDRDPADVVADVTARPQGDRRRRPSWSNPARLAAAAVVILAVGLTAIIGPRLLDRSSGASSPSMAVVNGVEYIVGLGRGLRIDDSDLSPYGLIESFNDPRFVGGEPTAFRLHGVDPLAALIVRSAPGLSDDSGPFPEYLVLTRSTDSYAALCAYYESKDTASPTECRTATPGTPSPTTSAAPSPRPSSSASPVLSPSPSPSPTASPSPSPTAYDGDRVEDHLTVLLMERTGQGCASFGHVDWDLRAIRRQAEAVALNGEVGVVGEENFVLGTLAEAIEGFNGELAATEGPDVAWYLSDTDDVELIGGGRKPDADLFALKLQRITVDDGREVWWRTLDYVGVGFCR